jgi:hypothetical protein
MDFNPCHPDALIWFPSTLIQYQAVGLKPTRVMGSESTAVSDQINITSSR